MSRSVDRTPVTGIAPEPMPIIVGSPRSGTTLLRFMLDAHPLLAIPPETGFMAATALYDCDPSTPEGLFDLLTTFPPDAPAWLDFGLDAAELHHELKLLAPFDLAQGFRVFFRLYARKHHKLRYGDKTPLYSEHLGLLNALLPEAHFIHIIRDGRDVALSLRPTWFAPGHDMSTLAEYWQRMVQKARASGQLCRAYMEVSYEQLIVDAPTVLAGVCDFIQLPFDNAMLRYWEQTPERLSEHRTRRRADGSILMTHEQRLEAQRRTMEPPLASRIGRWQREMNPEEQAVFVAVAGTTLQELGYAR